MPTIQQWQKIGILGGLAVFVAAMGGLIFYIENDGCGSGGSGGRYGSSGGTPFERCVARQRQLADDTLTNYDRRAAERLCAGER
jgi:hypothetical protein